MSNKRGSSVLLLAMIFTAFAMVILSSILIAREWTVKSECEAFGRVFAKAILSEYDKHLLQDYGILGYQGNDAAVEEKIRQYMAYSMKGKLRVRDLDAEAGLGGYELSDPANFRKAMKDGFGGSLAEALVHGGTRHARGKEEVLPERSITNPVVLDTLPSGHTSASVDAGALSEKLKSGNLFDAVTDTGSSAAVELAFIRTYFSSHTMKAGSLESYFPHELEYIVRGSADDQTNYKSCRRKIFLIRNAMNLISVYKDPEKVEVVSAVAELITPGPLALVTQGVLMEAWAALESENDVQTLVRGGRVPLIKTPAQWQTGLRAVLDSKEVRQKLDEEAEALLRENEGEILKDAEGFDAGKEIAEGQTYEDYLMVMILTMNSNTRLRRIMDLVQINMKYRYYEEFSLEEYYTGVRFSMHVDQNSYEFEDHYR